MLNADLAALSPTVDVSHFTCLTVLDLCYEEKPLDQQLTSLRKICTSISSHQLEVFHMALYDYWNTHPLNALLATLAGLREVDTVLSRPQFGRLSDVTFRYYLKIYVQGPATSDPSPSIFLDDMMVNAALSSQQTPADDGDGGASPPIHAQGLDLDGTERLSYQDVEELVGRKTEEELSQLHFRGILKKAAYVASDRTP